MKPLPLNAPSGTRVLVVTEGKLVRTKTHTAPFRQGPHDLVLLDGLADGHDIERVFLDEANHAAIREA